MRRACRLASALALALMATPAGAALCFAGSSGPAFGLYDTLAAGNDDVTATVTVTCTPGIGSPLTTAYTVTIAGTGTGNDTARSIAAGGKRLYYQLYKDAARTVVWGNGSSSGTGVAGTVTSPSTALPASQTHTVYARMAAGQKVPAAIYTGSMLVTIDY